MAGDDSSIQAARTNVVVLHTDDPSAAPAAPQGPSSPTKIAIGNKIIVQHRVEQIDGDVRALQLTNPRLLHTLQQFQTTGGTTPLAGVHMPTLLAPDTAPPTDATVFVNPDDSTQRYCYGGFRLSSTESRPPMKWVELRPEGAGTTLAVHLTPIPSSAGLPPPPAVSVTRCFLHATVHEQVVERDFDLAIDAQGRWGLTLHVEDPDGGFASRDQLYRAMTLDPDAKIIVRRQLQVAVPAAPKAATTTTDEQPPPRRVLWTFPRTLHQPLAMSGTTQVMRNVPIAMMRPIARPAQLASIHVPAPVAPAPVAPAPAPAPAIIKRPFIDVLPRPPTTPTTTGKPVLVTPDTHTTTTTTTPPPPPVPQVTLQTVTVDSTVPFSFQENLDANVFAKVSGTAALANASGWQHFTLPWPPDADAKTPAKNHLYLQDAGDPKLIYYLPDEFVIERHAEAPHKPWLRLNVLDGGAMVSLTYVAVPVVSPDRIAAATATLMTKAGVPADIFPLRAFLAANRTFRLKVPNADGKGGPAHVEQTGANVDTTTGIDGSLTLRPEDLDQVLDAITSDDSDLLTGVVELTIDGEKPQIPFSARASKFAGSVCDYAIAADATNTALVVTVTNAIESAITVPALPIAFVRDKQPVSLDPSVATPALPATLGPGDSLTLTFQDDAHVPLDHLEIFPDESKLDVKIDRAQFLDAIMDPSIQGQATLPLTIQIAASVFAPPADKKQQLILVQFEFKGSPKSVNFSADMAAPPPGGGAALFLLTQQIDLPVPLRTYLLGQLTGDAAGYAYRVHRVYVSGTQRVDPTWTQATQYSLYVDVTADVV